MLGPFGEDCDLRSHGLELASRGGWGAKKKAVVAIGRKLSVVMLSIWKSGADYEPLRNMKKAA
jgi:transposase